jgi:hypothetical protein
LQNSILKKNLNAGGWNTNNINFLKKNKSKKATPTHQAYILSDEMEIDE